MDDKRRIVSVPVTWDAANRKKDRSVGMRFTTNLEITNEEFAHMDTFIGSSGWLVFAENEVQPHQVPDVPADEAIGKMTPSQEMRWLLKKLYEQRPRDEDWSDFYRRMMGNFNKQLREQLD